MGLETRLGALQDPHAERPHSLTRVPIARSDVGTDGAAHSRAGESGALELWIVAQAYGCSSLAGRSRFSVTSPVFLPVT